MHLVACAALALCFAVSGCFGGCYTSSYAMVWEDEAVAAALRARADWDGNVTANDVGPGLPINATLLPLRNGDASLVTVILSWPAETPEMDVSELRLRPDRDGSGTLIFGLIDAYLGKSRFSGHIDTFLTAILADPADAPAVKAAVLADYEPGQYDFSDGVNVPLDAPLALDALLSQGDAPWVADRVGLWSRENGDWRFESLVASWRWYATEDWRGELAADAAGHVQGPALPTGGDHESPARADVEAQTTALLEILGLPAPPADADLVGAGRTCVD